MSIELVMSPNRLILCHPFLLMCTHKSLQNAWTVFTHNTSDAKHVGFSHQAIPQFSEETSGMSYNSIEFWHWYLELAETPQGLAPKTATTSDANPKPRLPVLGLTSCPSRVPKTPSVGLWFGRRLTGLRDHLCFLTYYKVFSLRTAEWWRTQGLVLEVCAELPWCLWFCHFCSISIWMFSSPSSSNLTLQEFLQSSVSSPTSPFLWGAQFQHSHPLIFLVTSPIRGHLKPPPQVTSIA